MTDITNPFASFWMGGYECTDQLNAHGDRVDFLHVTAHLDLIREDYALLGEFGIKTVREGLRWSQVEKRPYEYDFRTLGAMLEAGCDCGIQQVWDICHFGYPDDLTPLHPHFTRRFASLCRAFADYHATYRPDETLIVTPVNEVSFMSWLGGDVAGTSPYCRNNGWELKYALMRAYIAGIRALREVDPGVRILTTEPLVNVVPTFDATEAKITEATHHHELQYQSLDILCGRICPELGGSPDCLDILGFNFYYNNQWEFGTNHRLPWNDLVMDPRWRSLDDLLWEAHRRYNRPVVLSETSHPGLNRPLWIERVALECSRAIEQGMPLWGICLYPIIDRPNWDHPDDWHLAGLWDVDYLNSEMTRVLHNSSALALRVAQQVTANAIQAIGSHTPHLFSNFGAKQIMSPRQADEKDY